MDNVIDVSEQFPTAVRADQNGKNVLILRNIDPMKRMDGKKANMEIEYRWLSNEEDVNSVQGNDFSYWRKDEIKWNECLFDQVNLF